MTGPRKVNVKPAPVRCDACHAMIRRDAIAVGPSECAKFYHRVCYTQVTLRDAAIALRHYAQDMQDTYAASEPGGRRDYPFGRDAEAACLVALGEVKP